MTDNIDSTADRVGPDPQACAVTADNGGVGAVPAHPERDRRSFDHHPVRGIGWLAGLSRAIVRAGEVLITLLMVLMLVMVLWQVLGRFWPPAYYQATDEVARYSLTSMVFLGLPVVAGHLTNISIDVVQELVKSTAVVRVLGVTAALGDVVFLAVMAWVSGDWLADIWGGGQVTPSLELPIEWFRLPMVVGFAAAAVVTLDLLIARIVFPRDVPWHPHHSAGMELS